MSERALRWRCKRCGSEGPVNPDPGKLHGELAYVGIGPGSKLVHTSFPPPYGLPPVCGEVEITSQPDDAITRLSRLAEET